MILERLTVKGFKGIKDIKLDFKKGINLIKGSNEAGKSTITQAVLTGLFGNAKSLAAGAMEAKAWNANSLYRIEIIFSHEGHRYQIIRDYEAKQQELVNLSTGEKWVDKKRIEERLLDIIGFTKQSVFTSTAVVQQAELARLEAAKDELTNMLEVKVSGSGYVDVRNVIKQLKARVSALKKSGSKDPGIIAMEKTRLQELQNHREEISNELVRFEEAIKEKFCCEEQLPIKLKELEIKKKALASAAKFKQCSEKLKLEEKSLETTQKQLNDLQQYKEELAKTQAVVKQLQVQLTDSEQNLKKQEEFRVLSTKVKLSGEEIEAMQKKLEQILKAKNELEKLSQQLSFGTAIEEEKVNKAQKLHNDLEVYGRLAKTQGFHILVKPEKQLSVSYTCDGNSTSTHEQSVEFTLTAQSKAELNVPGVIEISVENKDVSVRDNLLLFQKTEQELSEILSQNGCQTIDELLKKFKNYQELIKQKGIAEQIYKGFLQGGKIEHYQTKMNQIVEQQKDYEKQIAGLQVEPMDEDIYQKTKNAVQELRNQLTEVTVKQNELNGAIKVSA